MIKNSRNGICAALLFLGVVVFLYLSAFGFELKIQTSIWVVFIQILITLLSLIIIPFLRTKWFYKLFAALGVLLLYIYIVPNSGLWEYSLKHYVEHKKSDYEIFVEEIRDIDTTDIVHFLCWEGKPNARHLKEDSIVISQKLLESNLCAILESLDSREVFINTKRRLYLFSLSRIIDNGYGLLYSVDEVSIEMIRADRIAGLEIRAVVPTSKRWYYVSFT